MSKILDLPFADENRATLDSGDEQTGREVANRAAECSGASSTLLGKMLPVLPVLGMAPRALAR